MASAKLILFTLISILLLTPAFALVDPIIQTTSELKITKYDGIEAQTYLAEISNTNLCLYHKAGTSATSIEELRQIIKEAQDNVQGWEVGVFYKVNDLVKYNSQIYKVLQAHTSQSDWNPSVVPALFVLYFFQNLGEVPKWVQPTGAHDAYIIGSRVWFQVGENKLIYESQINANVWSPSAYPAGWKEIGRIQETEVYGEESITAINAGGSSIIVPRNMTEGLSTYCVEVENKIQIGQNTIIAEWINSSIYIYPSTALELDPFKIEIFCNGVQLESPDMTWRSVEPIKEGVKFSAHQENFSCVGNFTFRQNTLAQSYDIARTQFYSETSSAFIDYSDFEANNNITNKVITSNYPSLFSCMWDNGFVFVSEIKDCLATTTSYDITYTGTFNDLDPSMQVTINSGSALVGSGSDYWTNRTEGTYLGARLDAPVLFMDFNEPAEGAYVQDNSLYNNYGYLSSSNIVGNPDFETFTGTADDSASDDFASWQEITDDAGGNRVEASTTKQSGSYGLKIVNTNNGKRVYQRLNVTPGQAYDWTFYARGTGSAAGRFYAVCLNSTGSTVHTLYATQSTGVTSATFTQVSKPFVTPGNCSIVEISFISGTTGTTVYFDNVVLAGASPDTSPTYNATGGYDGGGSYSFDGVNDYIDLGSFYNFGANSFSISAWVFIKPSSALYPGIFSTTGSPENYIHAEYHKATNKFRLYYDNNGVNGHVTSNNISLNTWYHVVFIKDAINRTNKIYVNGEDDTIIISNYTSYNVNHTSSRIGYTFSNMNGSIDQVQIWDRALSADEILNIYNGTINNSNYIGKYSREGDFKSLVYYNENQSIWNSSFNIADTYSPRTGVTTNEGINLSHPNLVSYWALDGNALDATGRNNGTLVGGVNNATGLSSDALRFDGVDDYVNTSSGAQVGNNFSVFLWANFNNLYRQPLIVEDNGNGGDFIISTGSGNTLFGDVRTTGGTSNITPAYTINTGVWYHVGLIKNGNILALWVNGNNVTQISGATTVPSNIGDILIGRKTDWYGVGTRYFNGSIDEVLIYNTSLSASEISQLYKAGLSQHANTNLTLQTRVANQYNLTDTSLVSQWDFNNGTARDTMGRNNGTIINGTVINETSGVLGRGSHFDGVDDGILVANSSSINPAILTISAWVKLDGVQPANGGSVVVKQSTGFTHGYSFRVSQTGRAQLVYRGTSGNIRASNSNLLSYQKWYHIVGKYDGTNISMYVNGVLENTSNVNDPILHSPTGLGIGMANVPGVVVSGTYFDGSIDEVRMYNRSLSTDEIQQLYEMGSNFIEWNAWQDEGVITSGVDSYSSIGNYYQYNAILNTNDTKVSPYIQAFNITAILDVTPPYWVTIPNNVTFVYNTNFLDVTFEAQDDESSFTYGINYSDPLYIDSSNGNLVNISALAGGVYIVNVTATNIVGLYTDAIFVLTVLPADQNLHIDYAPHTTVSNNTRVAIYGYGCLGNSVCMLYRNTTIVDNPYFANLTVGSYNFTFNTTGTQNYTDSLQSLIVNVLSTTPPIWDYNVTNTNATYVIYNRTSGEVVTWYTVEGDMYGRNAILNASRNAFFEGCVQDSSGITGTCIE